MKEQLCNVYFGTLMHLSHFVVFIISLFFMELTFTNIILSVVLSSLPIGIITIYVERKYPLVNLPQVTLSDVIFSFADSVVYSLFIGHLIIYYGYKLLNDTMEYKYYYEISAITILMHFLLADITYYLTHRLLYHGIPNNLLIKLFRRMHIRHHLITGLDFLRGNTSTIFDIGVFSYPLSCVIYAKLFGLDYSSLLISYSFTVLLQTIHHSNYTFNIGIMRYIFVDSHVHKIHHCLEGHLYNFGGILSIWDRIFGTYYENYDICPNYIHLNKLSLSTAIQQIED